MIRPVCHSSALDPLAFAAQAQGYSGSGVGLRSHRLMRERRRSRAADRACVWALAVLALVVIASVARWAI